MHRHQTQSWVSKVHNVKVNIINVILKEPFTGCTEFGGHPGKLLILPPEMEKGRHRSDQLNLNEWAGGAGGKGFQEQAEQQPGRRVPAGPSLGRDVGGWKLTGTAQRIKALL